MEMQSQNTVNECDPEKMAKGDLIQRIMGNFGRYQLIVYILLFFAKVFAAFHQMAVIFLAPKVSYICGANGTETCPCLDPIYDTSIFSRTIIMEWDLICDRKWLISFSQTIFQLGVLLGSVVFGMAADRYGRKPPMLAAVLIQISTGISATYAPGYWIFTLLRFFVGMSVGGIMVVGFVILMEFVGTKYREIMSALYQAPFTLGHMLLPVFGYYLRDYADLQLALSTCSIVMLFFFVLLLETPRWLVATNKTDEAIHILKRVAKMNKRKPGDFKAELVAHQASVEQNQLKKGNILDLFRTPNMRKNTIAMSINWLACGYCYYGISQYIGQLSGNVFINVASSALITMIGTLVTIPLARAMKRRTFVIVFHFLSAGCLLVLAVIPEGVGSVIFATIGVLCSCFVFMIVYLYCSEMFPTVVRNAAVGFSSMMARVGSMVAPFVIDMQSIGTWVPPVAFAILPLIAGFATFFLPETKGCELLTTLEDGEQFQKKITKK